MDPHIPSAWNAVILKKGLSDFRQFWTNIIVSFTARPIITEAVGVDAVIINAGSHKHTRQDRCESPERGTISQ